MAALAPGSHLNSYETILHWIATTAECKKAREDAPKIKSGSFDRLRSTNVVKPLHIRTPILGYVP